MTAATAPTFHRTREAWLTAAAATMAPWFADAGTPLPDVRVSVGWPGGRRARANVIGQCWSPAAAADGVQQIYISPALDDPAAVLSTLAHELVHAADHCEHGHRGRFATLARRIGLDGPLTATHAGPELAARLDGMREGLGAYPHAALVTGASSHKPQGTRMLKVECPQESGYMVRMTRRWLDEYGAPVCPHCAATMVESS